MLKLIQAKIKSLRDEIAAKELTHSLNNLKRTSFDDKQILCLRAKIEVLNEIIISYGIQK